MENGKTKPFESMAKLLPQKRGVFFQPAMLVYRREDSHTGSKSPKREKIIGVDIDPQLEVCFIFLVSVGKQETTEKERGGETTTKGALFALFFFTFFFCCCCCCCFDLDMEKKRCLFS